MHAHVHSDVFEATPEELAAVNRGTNNSTSVTTRRPTHAHTHNTCEVSFVMFVFFILIEEDEANKAQQKLQRRSADCRRAPLSAAHHKNKTQPKTAGNGKESEAEER